MFVFCFILLAMVLSVLRLNDCCLPLWYLRIPLTVIGEKMNSVLYNFTCYWREMNSVRYNFTCNWRENEFRPVKLYLLLDWKWIPSCITLPVMGGKINSALLLSEGKWIPSCIFLPVMGGKINSVLTFFLPGKSATHRYGIWIDVTCTSI